MTSHTDPDRLLSHVLAGIDDWEKAPVGSRAEREAAERATACMASLDFHMRHGGEMPSAWMNTRPDGSGSHLDHFRLAWEEVQKAPLDLVSTEKYRHAFVLAFRALLDKDSEIARLKQELDSYQGREVIFGLDRFLQSNISDGALPAKPIGSIARATDTGREWELTEDGWQVRHQYQGRHA